MQIRVHLCTQYCTLLYTRVTSALACTYIILILSQFPVKNTLTAVGFVCVHFCFRKKNKTKRQTFSLGFFITFFSTVVVVATVFRAVRPAPKRREQKITLNDNVQTIIAVRPVLYVESVWGAVATEIL